MSAGTAALVVLALAMGLIAGFALARMRRVPRVVVVEPAEISAHPEDDTRPTLVPFRLSREVGRNLARTDPDEDGDASGRDHLDALLADLDRRKDR